MIFKPERGTLTGELTERYNFTGKKDHDGISKYYPEGRRWFELAISDEDAKELEFYGCKVRAYVDSDNKEYKAVRIRLANLRRFGMTLVEVEGQSQYICLDLDQSDIVEEIADSIERFEAIVDICFLRDVSTLITDRINITVTKDAFDKIKRKLGK